MLIREDTPPLSGSSERGWETGQTHQKLPKESCRSTNGFHDSCGHVNHEHGLSLTEEAFDKKDQVQLAAEWENRSKHDAPL